MTITSIPDDDLWERFVATSGQTVFPFDFPIFAASDLQVKRERFGVESVLLEGTDYNVAGVEEQFGGTITLTTGALAGDIIVLQSAMKFARTTQFVNGGDLPASALENEFNRIRILLQQIMRANRPAVLYPDTDPAMPPLPPKASRAGRFLAFDAEGQPYAAGAPGTALDMVARAGDTMTGPLRVPAGSAAAPGLTPAGRPNLGFFSPFNDQLAVAVAGQQVANFTSSALVLRDPLVAPPAPVVTAASAASINLATLNSDAVRITGANSISSFGNALSNTQRILIFDGAATIVHNGTNLICPGNANITMAPGDVALVIAQSANVWKVAAVWPAQALPALRGLITNSALTMSGPGLAGRLSTGAGALQEIKLGNLATALVLGINRYSNFGTGATYVDEQSIPGGGSTGMREWNPIPAGVRRIKLMFDGMSKAGTSLPLIQIGQGILATSGYRGGAGGVTTAATSASSTQGFMLTPTIAAADILDGEGELLNIRDDKWLWNFRGFLTTVNRAVIASGRIALGSTGDHLVRLIAANGTDAFTAGNWSMTAEF